MELYIDGKKCSLFGDEEIEITKSWNDNQMIISYGSYSKTFSIPADKINNNILKNYYIIGNQTTINPSYFISSYIEISGYQINGNISIQGVSYKKGILYSYNITFYGYEKNLLKELNTSEYKKLNDIPLGSDYTFQYNYPDIPNTWPHTGLTVFVPLISHENEYVYSSFSGFTNNIAYPYEINYIKVKDLRAYYHMKTLLKDIFSVYGITFNHSSEVEKLLYEMYIKPGPNPEYVEASGLTYIHSRTVDAYINNETNEENVISIYNSDSYDPKPYGYLPGNTDFISYVDIMDWAYSQANDLNYYECQTGGIYNFEIVYNRSTFHPQYNIKRMRIYPRYYHTMDYITDINNTNNNGYSTTDYIGTISFRLLLDAGDKVQLSCDYNLTRGNQNKRYQFDTNEVDFRIKINKVPDQIYNYFSIKPVFIDMLVSDFFINFCKSFNIFFIYDDENKIINTYFKDDFDISYYDLTKYNIIKDYSLNTKLKYKTIDYKFKEGKDIGNIEYRKRHPTNFGQYLLKNDYDIGQEKLEFTSIFNVHPDLNLNKIDSLGNIIGATNLIYYNELDEGGKEVSNDFTIIYKRPMYPTSDYYYFQFDYDDFTSFISAPGFGSYNLSGYTTDYNNLITKFNTYNDITNRFETQMDFILPFNIIYNLNVYDVIIVSGIYYEIKDFTFNIKTGYTKMKLTTI